LTQINALGDDRPAELLLLELPMIAGFAAPPNPRASAGLICIKSQCTEAR